MHMQKHEFLLIFAHFTAACAKNNNLRCKATIIQTQFILYTNLGTPFIILIILDLFVLHNTIAHLMSDLLYKVNYCEKMF